MHVARRDETVSVKRVQNPSGLRGRSAAGRHYGSRFPRSSSAGGRSWPSGGRTGWRRARARVQKSWTLVSPLAGGPATGRLIICSQIMYTRCQRQWTCLHSSIRDCAMQQDRWGWHPRLKGSALKPRPSPSNRGPSPDPAILLLLRGALRCGRTDAVAAVIKKGRRMRRP